MSGEGKLLSFVIGDVDPKVSVTVREVTAGRNTALQFDVAVTGKTKTADLRGVFFTVAKPSRAEDLEITGRHVGEYATDEDGLTKVTNDVTMAGTHKTFNVGVEIGSQGIGKDDIQSTTFVVAAEGSNLGLDFVMLQDFGIRLTSVGDVGGKRGDSLKLTGSSPKAGSDGDDTLDGGKGDDDIDCGEGDDDSKGGEGDDSIHGGAGSDTLGGGAGDDTVVGGSDDDTVMGGGGSDSVTGGSGDDSVAGGEGSDSVTGGAGSDTVQGGDGDDSAHGGAGDDTVGGGGGDDVAAGAAGADLLTGGAGDDRLLGGNGDDTLHGDRGNDTLEGGSGNDLLSDGQGADRMAGGAGDDTLFGNDGDDTMTGDAGADLLYGADGADLLYGDAMEGGDGADDLIESGAGNDTAFGGAGDDEIQGEGGDDIITGGKDGGSFALAEGKPVDVVIGDNLFGNDGADQFLFAAGDGVDLIWDIQPGQDRIVVSGYTLADLEVAFAGVLSNDGRSNGPDFDSGSHDKLMLMFGGKDAIVFNDFPGRDSTAPLLQLDDGVLSAADLFGLL